MSFLQDTFPDDAPINPDESHFYRPTDEPKCLVCGKHWNDPIHPSGFVLATIPWIRRSS
jgi:hypothetical protein